MSVRARVGYDEVCVFPRGFDVRVSTRDGQVIVRVELHDSARAETMPLEPHEARVIAGLLRRATEGFDETAPTVREAARRRMPLDGSDAQALEGALAMTESERDVAIAERDRLRRELEALRDRVAEWAERDPGLDDIVVALNLIVDGVPT